MNASSGELKRLLDEFQEDAPRARDELSVAAYEELRRIAHAAMRDERGDHTLEPTGLAHEAWARLLGTSSRRFASRAHFFHSAANEIRRVLVEHARRRLRGKRRGDRRLPVDPDRLPPEELHVAGQDEADQDLIDLDAALRALEELDPPRAHLVHLRYFVGLGIAETSRVLGVSESTVAREWRVARAFLRGRLERRET